MRPIPNPGSDEAMAAGCTCPVLDNARGRGWMCSGIFWITQGCPLHHESDWVPPEVLEEEERVA